ncbi:MAG: hypothetical protein Q7K34_00060 [archaeon]|nr:hypothetical protein [archaeon]
MDKKILFALLAVAVFLGASAQAHEISGEAIEPIYSEAPADYLPADPFQIALYVFILVMVLSVFSIFFQDKMPEKAKKIVFIIVVVTVGLTTLYAAATTVYLNVISESGGPVHWHADFELWVCGEKISNLKAAEFPSNKVGTAVLHHHDDYRMHVEGLVISKEDVSLSAFFNAIGGEFINGHFRTKLENGEWIDKSDGETCPDGKPGKWRLYAKNHATGEFEENTELEDYVIKPFFTITPGDYLKLAFDSTGGAPIGG